MGCGSDPRPLEPRIDIDIKRAGCVASCAVDRFELYLIKALAGRRCVFRRSTASGNGDHVEDEVEVSVGEDLEVWVLGYCGQDTCVRCAGSQTMQARQEAVATVELKTTPTCNRPHPVTVPCDGCDPSEKPRCEGDTLVSCSPDGEEQNKSCPNGCKDGACIGCTKSTFHRDADGDGFGDPGKSVEECEVPQGYVTDASDCDDGDKEANPKQTAFFDQPTDVTKSFDYNCDGTEEKKHTSVASCLSSPFCTKGGWRSAAPGCGKSGTWITCKTTYIWPFCGEVTASRTQPCR